MRRIGPLYTAGPKQVKHACPLPGFLVIALAVGSPLYGGVIVSVQSVTAPAGTNGAFEVSLTNTGPDLTDVFGFSFDISVPSGSGVTFLDATTATIDPYVFDGDSLLGPDLVDGGFTPGPTLAAADLWGGAGNGPTISTNTTVGLGEVFFRTASGTPVGPVTVTLDPNGTSLSDGNGDPISIDSLNGGTITVAAATPEPASILLVLFGTVVLPFRKLRNRYNGCR